MQTDVPTAARPRVLVFACLALVLAYALLDAAPRFFQGDSISYLNTDYHLHGWLPPDRSWVFGALANFLLRKGHGYHAYVFLQSALLVAVLLVLCRTAAAEGRGRAAAMAVGCLAIAADPLAEIYTRFLMSDFLASAAFLLALCAAAAICRPVGGYGWGHVALGVVSIGVAVLMRSSYGLMIEGALAAGLVLLRPGFDRRRLLALACILAAAPAALGLQVAANRVVFRHTYPHETFVMKQSGVFLAAVFSPALAREDFAKAGVPLSQEEFDRLPLKDRNLRNAEIWADTPRFMHKLIEDKLKTTDDYSLAVDRVSKALVVNAAKRDPLGVLRVYLQNAADYFTPARWRYDAEREMGVDRDLPQDFLNFSNQFTRGKLTADSTRQRSLLMRETLGVYGLYPIQLALGVVAAVFLLFRERRSACCVFLACGALIALALAPLYSVYVIPRYLLPAIMANYALIALAVGSMAPSLAGRPERATEPRAAKV